MVSPPVHAAGILLIQPLPWKSGVSGDAAAFKDVVIDAEIGSSAVVYGPGGCICVESGNWSKGRHDGHCNINKCAGGE